MNDWRKAKLAVLSLIPIFILLIILILAGGE